MKGRTPLHEIVLATGALRAVSSVGAIDAWALAPDASFAVAARRRIGSPHELWRLDVGAGGEGTRLTTHNAAFEKEVDVRPAEEITVPGAGGKPVHVWIVKPHGFDPAKKYPLILNVHGGPQQQWADAYRGDWQVYPGAGYVVAFPNPHGSTGFGQAYTSAISGDWNGKVMTDIEKVADALEKLPYVDKDRMGAMGWSWGGYAMMWLEGHTTRFKALASMMGVYDLRAMYSSTEEVWFPQWDLKGAPWENPALYKAHSPSEYVTAFKTPCLVITGEKDYRVPVHAVARVLHGPAGARRPVAPHRLREGGPLAERVRDGALLRRAPRLVPPVARRPPVAVEAGGPRRGPLRAALVLEEAAARPRGEPRHARARGADAPVPRPDGLEPDGGRAALRRRRPLRGRPGRRGGPRAARGPARPRLRAGPAGDAPRPRGRERLVRGPARRPRAARAASS